MSGWQSAPAVRRVPRHVRMHSRHSRKAHRRTTPNHVPNSLPIHLSSIPRASLTAGGGPGKTRPALAIVSTSNSYRLTILTYNSSGLARHTTPPPQHQKHTHQRNITNADHQAAAPEPDNHTKHTKT